MGGLGSLATAGASVFNTVSLSRALKPVAKAAAGAGMTGLPALPTIGTGGMSFPALTTRGAQTIPAGLSLGPGGIAITPNGVPTPNMAGGSMGPRGPVYMTVTTPSGRTIVTGYRSLGRPMLWSGDLAAVKRVARVRRKLGAGHRRRF
jgi:hypothetical protein